MEPNDNTMGFEMELSDQEIRTLYYCICEAIRVWPGSPARPAEEQEYLYHLKSEFFKMILEISLEA